MFSLNMLQWNFFGNVQSTELFTNIKPTFQKRFNPSRPDPEQREKINWKLLFSLFFVMNQKALWRPLKCENKNLSLFLF